MKYLEFMRGNTPLALGLFASVCGMVAVLYSIFSVDTDSSSALDALKSYGAMMASTLLTTVAITVAAYKEHERNTALVARMTSAEERISRFEAQAKISTPKAVVIAKFSGSPILRVGQQTDAVRDAQQPKDLTKSFG